MPTDSSFAAMQAANPYVNQQYNKSPWQDFLSTLGMRTEADAWQENMSVQAAEYNAALLQKQHDEEYNDPSAQVSRLRKAGINPDLQSGAIDAGSPGDMGTDMSTPMQSSGEENVFSDGAKICLNAANMIMSGFTSGLGLVSSIQGIYSNRLNNRLKSLEGESAFNDFVSGIWTTFLPDSPEDETMLNQFDWKAQAYKNAEKFSGQLPRKFRQKFLDSVSRYWESAPGSSEAYKTWLDRVNNRRDFYEGYQTNYSDIDSVLKLITEPFADLSQKIYNQSLKTDLAQLKEGEIQARNESEYLSELDPSLQAGAENAGNNLAKMNSEMVSSLNDTLNQIVTNLKSKAEEGGIPGALCQIALVAVASARLWLANVGAPSISRSSSITHTDNYGKNSRSRKDSHSSSFNLKF